MSCSNGKVTLEDIARATGYTINTVSRALKNKSDISRATCEKIQQTAREMGYVRNYIASSLRAGRTKTIAVVAGSLTNVYYAVLVELVQKEASRLGYTLMILCSQDDPDTETQAVEMALQRQVDGVLITPCAVDSPALKMLRESGIPFVLLSRYLRMEADDSVISDDEQGGYLAGRYLLEHGHTRLAYLSYHHVVYSTRTRYEGFLRACAEAGLQQDAVFQAEVCEEADILAQVRAWMQQGVTGIFSFCDVEAWSTISILENNGYSVPRDVEIVGFDNILGYMNFPKPITSVDGNLPAIANTAIDILRRRIHDPSLPPQQIMQPVRLVER